MKNTQCLQKMRLVDAKASIMPGIDVGKCGARPRQIAIKKCESTDASTFFEMLNYLGECTHEKEIYIYIQ